MRTVLAILALSTIALAHPGTAAGPMPGTTCEGAAPLPAAAGAATIVGVLEDGAAHWWTRSVPGTYDVVGEGFNLGYYHDCATPAWGCEGGTRLVAQTGCSTAHIIVVSNFGWGEVAGRGAYAIVVR